MKLNVLTQREKYFRSREDDKIVGHIFASIYINTTTLQIIFPGI